MNTLEARLESLTPEKRALVARLLAEKRQAPSEAPIPRRRDRSRAPASFVQERLWLLSELEPRSPFYNTPLAVRLRGPLDVRALHHCLGVLAERHEALRTTFGAGDAAPVQLVHETAAVDLDRVDLSGLGRGEREGEAEKRLAEAGRRPFDLARGPLFRAVLWHLGDEDHLLLLVLHHAVADGWSVGVLLADTAALYAAGARGRAAGLAPLPVQYGDYAAWQRRTFDDDRLESLLAHWRQNLEGAPQVLELPADRPRPVRRSYRGAVETALVPRPLLDALRELARAEGATLFMTLLGAYAALLWRYTRQADLLVGTPVANRPRPELEGLVGCFVNTLPLRSDLSGDPAFRDLLHRVRFASLEAFRHEAVPFEKLVEAVQKERDPSRNPLFQVFFVLQNAPLPALEVGALTLEARSVDTGTAKFDLSLSAQETAEGLAASLEYSTDLFEAATAARFLGHFETLLEGIAADPRCPLSDLPLLTAAERRTVLTAWNSTEVDYPAGRGIHEMIEDQASRSPDAVAVACEGRLLTYAGLTRRAGRLARRLRRLGAGPEVLVGVAMERSTELVVALLAVLKSGAAYVPLEPTFPRERLAFMLGETGADVLLTQRRLLAGLPPHPAPTVAVDADFGGEERDDSLEPATADPHLAYVIYTSGSTGRPKGAMNTHAAIRNRLLWMQDAYRLTPEDRVLQKTPFTFDVSVWEFFWPLMYGARLVVARPGGHQDPSYLARTVRDEGITTLHFVPSMLQLFLEEEEAGTWTSLKRVVASGEALSPDLQKRFFDTFDGVELHNLYGPTEAAVDVTFWACRREASRRAVPIGRPIANTRILILDPRLHAVPVGVPGELMIGGAGLARGYLRRPGLTADRFVPSPESRRPGERLYRTGDRCRFLADGNVEYLGRFDHQVKIRGVRIELGEIEAALREHPSLAETAVVVREDAAGDRRLVAYAVAEPGRAASAEELRRFLLDRLPEAMVPAVFVPLESLPLSANGKLDRKALPAPEVPEACPAESTPPRTPLEAEVARAFSEVLGLPSPGADDSFFGLGGDSFKAIRLVRALGGRVPVAEVFTHPTVRALAARIEAGAERPPGRLHLLRRSVRRPMATLISIPYGGGSVVAYRPLAEALPEGWDLYAVELPGHEPGGETGGPRKVETLARALAEEIAANVSGPIAIYGHCVGSALAVEVTRRLEAVGRRVTVLFVAGALPPRRRWHRLEIPLILRRNRRATDAGLHARLRALGGFTGELDDDDRAFVIGNFRRDLEQALGYFGRTYRASNGGLAPSTPIVCVVGDRDPFTRGYARRFHDWRAFGADVDLAVIPGAGHYFVQRQALALARIVTERTRRDEVPS